MTIKGYAYFSDHGDGGGSCTLYNSLEKIQEDRFEDDEKRFQSALAGDNLYEDGAISPFAIRLIEGPNGEVLLGKPLFISWGQ